MHPPAGRMILSNGLKETWNYSLKSVELSNDPYLLSLTYEHWALAIVGFLLTILIAWTILGNFLVLASLVRFEKLRSTSNVLIGNLGTSDFLLALTVMPLSGVTDLLGYWIFGQVMCNVWLSIDVLCCTASIWSLVAIAFDRFTATTFPVWYRDQRNNNRVITYVSLVWVLSCLICLPPLIGWDGKTLENPRERFQKSYVFDNSTQRYICVLFNEPHYVIYSAMGSFIIPLVVMIMLYAKIFVVLQQRAKMLRENQRKNVRPRAGCYTNGSRPSIRKLSNTPSMELTSIAPLADPISISTATDTSNMSNIIIHSSRGEEKSQIPPPPPGGKIYSKYLAPPSTTTVHSLKENNSGYSSSGSAVALCSTSDDGRDETNLPVKERRLPRAFSVRNKRTTEKERNAKADRREQRATKRMAMIIIFFVLCWIPFTMMYIIRSLCGEERCPDYLHLRMFVIWLGYANSGLNPILYTIFNDDFREAFIRLLCGVKCAQRFVQRNRN